MDKQLLTKHFNQIGARICFAEGDPRRWTNDRAGDVKIDVISDTRGELFELRRIRGWVDRSVAVLDRASKDRHLLLQVADARFLCGHDERHWFTAAIPERARATSVLAAKEALMPEAVHTALERKRVRRRDRHRRRNDAFKRQGEWFFIPAPELRVNQHLVLYREPLMRGDGGKPHWVQELYRIGGVTVYVSRIAPNGFSPKKYKAWTKSATTAQKRDVRWEVMRRDPEVFARGSVRHDDHATIRLDGWHRVAMNTENKAVARRHVAFLD